MSIDDATKIVEDRKLGWHRKAGLLNQYPADSLVRQDFCRSNIIEFLARVTTVARRVGEDKAVSRISCGRFGPKGCETLHEWWEKASVIDRSRLLTSKKSEFKAGQAANPEFLKSIGEVGCPFQDTDLLEASAEGSETWTAW